MGYCCQGSEEYVTYKDLKKKCAEMSKMIDQKFKDLDDGEIKLLKTQIAAINSTLAGIDQRFANNENRIERLEEHSLDREITVEEVKNMYDKGDIDG